MGLFKRDKQEQQDKAPDRLALKQERIAQALQMRDQAMQMREQMMQGQQQAMESIAQAYMPQGEMAQGQMPQLQMYQAMQAAAGDQLSAAGQTPTRGSMSWARQVLAILAPAEPGFVKRCSCAVCGAPKKLPTITAYVYCDYCASLIDYDLRRACEGDTSPSPEYAALVNGTNARAKEVAAAGDRDAYRDLQKKIYEAYVKYVPMAVSHRARNDPGYVRAYVGYMAEAAVVRGFDPNSQALDAEMTRRVMGLRYGGNMLSPTVEPDSFWPLVELTEKQIEVYEALYRSANLADLDPDRSEHVVGKFSWSGFCQGWLGMLPTDAAQQLLERTGLVNEYVPVHAEDGQPRHCGGCGGDITALPDAKALICEGCGRMIDVNSAELRCANCGGSMTLPVGADSIACPYCEARVARVGIL
jgi:DNA-directed RNA polymerase subunit RPC12/RpoP